MSAFWDVLPTFCGVAGVEAPKGLDGISFLPALLGETQTEHDYLYWEFHEQGGKQAVRKGDWKAIRLEVIKGEPKTLLFNLKTDIGEKEDVSLQHKEITAELEAIMVAARTEDPEWPFMEGKNSK